MKPGSNTTSSGTPSSTAMSCMPSRRFTRPIASSLSCCKSHYFCLHSQAQSMRMVLLPCNRILLPDLVNLMFVATTCTPVRLRLQTSGCVFVTRWALNAVSRHHVFKRLVQLGRIVTRLQVFGSYLASHQAKTNTNGIGAHDLHPALTYQAALLFFGQGGSFMSEHHVQTVILAVLVYTFKVTWMPVPRRIIFAPGAVITRCAHFTPNVRQRAPR